MRALRAVKTLLSFLVAITCILLIYQSATIFSNTDSRGAGSLRQFVDKVDKMLSDTLESNVSSRPQATEAEVKARFQQRFQTLKLACQEMGNSSMFRRLRRVPKILGPFVPVMNKTINYCLIEKCGSSTWRLVLNNIVKEMNRLHVKENPDMRENNEELNFMFVREPYSRLLSAYVDKLLSPNTMYWHLVGRYIIQNFRTNPSERSLRCGHDVTFAEFIRYIIHSQETGLHRDGHFVPSHDHCNLCNSHYDYIGHLETVSEDMPYLLKLMNSPVNYTTDYDQTTVRINAGGLLKHMQTEIRECIGMTEARHRLWKKWHIRGIIKKTEPFPITDQEAEDIPFADFVAVAVEAVNRSGPKVERRPQHTEALQEAFASVALEDRLKLQKLLSLDFALFGFDPSPQTVFPASPVETPESGFSYFDIRA